MGPLRRAVWALAAIGLVFVPAAVRANLADCAVLETFIRAAGGSVGWTSGTECCGFARGARNVSCDATGRVTLFTYGPTPAEKSAFFPSNVLSGNMANLPSLAAVSQLETLGFTNNSFSGTAPTWLASLPNLKTLVLTANQLTGLPDLSALAPTLRLLDVGNNRLSGTAPAWIGNLINLSELWMGYNSLSGPLPDEWASLTSLQLLVLQYNKFNGTFPSYVSNFYNLLALVIRNNKFTGPFPNTDQMFYAQAIVADQNNFNGSIPSFTGNPNLVMLTLTYNNFTGNFTNLTALDQLRDLELEGNYAVTGNFDNNLPPNLLTCTLGGINACANDLANIPLQCRIAQAAANSCARAGFYPTPTPTPASSSSGSTGSTIGSAVQSALSKSVIGGISAGAILGGLAVVALLFFVWRYYKRRKARLAADTATKPMIGHVEAAHVAPGVVHTPLGKPPFTKAAVRGYKQKVADELTVAPGDVLTVEKELEAGWFVGKNAAGVTGVFPEEVFHAA